MQSAGAAQRKLAARARGVGAACVDQRRAICEMPRAGVLVCLVASVFTLPLAHRRCLGVRTLSAYFPPPRNRMQRETSKEPNITPHEFTREARRNKKGRLKTMARPRSGCLTGAAFVAPVRAQRQQELAPNDALTDRAPGCRRRGSRLLRAVGGSTGPPDAAVTAAWLGWLRIKFGLRKAGPPRRGFSASESWKPRTQSHPRRGGAALRARHVEAWRPTPSTRPRRGGIAVGGFPTRRNYSRDGWEPVARAGRERARGQRNRNHPRNAGRPRRAARAPRGEEPGRPRRHRRDGALRRQRQVLGPRRLHGADRGLVDALAPRRRAQAQPRRHARLRGLAQNQYELYFPGNLATDTAFSSLGKNPRGGSATPYDGKVQILFAIGLAEFHSEFGEGKGYKKHFTRGGPSRATRSSAPAGWQDVWGGKVLNIPFGPEDTDAKFRTQQNAELNNGRAAMIGIMGFSAAALVPGLVPALDGLTASWRRAGRSAPRRGDERRRGGALKS